MAYKPSNWLGPLIEEDIQAAVTWFKHTGSHPKVKRDPNARFEDDGSNLRSEVESQPLSDDQTVQIVKVISIEDPALLISDGFTSVKARLSTKAVAALESEIGETIDLETKGDVFAIRQCRTVSTPYGPTEGHVQLLIDDIKYHFHLRKIAGVASPIGERPVISRLMHEVMRIRHPEPAEEPPVQHVPHSRQKQSRRSDQFETQAEPRSPASQASVVFASSPPTAATQAPQSQPKLASQVPVRRRKGAPNMTRDGVEMASGVNLERPTAAIPSRFMQNDSMKVPAKPASISDSSANLLSVLGKRKAQPEPQKAAAAHSEPVRKSVSPQHNAPHAATTPTTGGATDLARSQLAANTVHSTQQLPQSHGASSTAQASRKPAGQQYWRRKIPKAQKRLLDQQSSWLPALPGRQFPHPNVPIELLTQWNKQAEQQPETVTLSQSLPARSQELAGHEGQMAGAEAEDDAGDSSEDISEDDEVLPWSSSPPGIAVPTKGVKTTAESPSRVRPVSVTGSNQQSPIRPSLSESSSSEVPPTSTGSLSRPSTAERRPDLPPDSSFEHAVAPRPLARPQDASRNSSKSKVVADSTSRVAASTRGVSAQQQAAPTGRRNGRSPQMLPPKPNWQQSPKGLFAPSAKSQLSPSQKSGRIVTQNSIQYRPPPASAPKAPASTSSRQRDGSARGSTSSERTSMSTSERAVDAALDPHFRLVTQTPDRGKMVPILPKSSPTTVIQATQVDRSGDAEKMDVDASRRVDPALEHQKRRSEYLRGEQRRNWIKANYTPDPRKPFNFGTLLSAYKRAHPKDHPRLSELADAYKDVYPDSPSTSQRATTHNPSRSPSASLHAHENVPPTFIRPRTSLADIAAPDSTPSRFPIEPVQPRAPELEHNSAAVMSALGGKATDSPTGVRPANEQETVAKTVHPPPSARYGNRSIHAPSATTAVNGGTEADALENATVWNRRQRRAAGRAEKTEQKRSAVQAKPAQPPAVPSPASTSRTTSGSGKAAPDHHAWLVKRIESDQRKLKNELVSKRKGGQEVGASFAEFVDAWKCIAPGGAFAEAQGEKRRRGQQQQRARLDVLGWEL